MLTFVICLALLGIITTSNWIGTAISIGASLFGASKDRKAAARAQQQAYERNMAQVRAGKKSLSGGAAQATMWDDLAMQDYEKAGSMMGSMGASGLFGMKQAYQAGIGNIQQQMASSGLGGTTVAGNLQRGALASYGQASASFTDRMMGQNLAAQQLLGGSKVAYGQNRYGEAVDMAQADLGVNFQAAQTSTGSGSLFGKLGGMLGGAIEGSDWWKGLGSGGGGGGHPAQGDVYGQGDYDFT